MTPQMYGNNTVGLRCHLVVDVYWRLDFLRGVAVYDPFHKLQARTDECNLPFPTAGPTVRASQRRREQV